MRCIPYLKGYDGAVPLAFAHFQLKDSSDILVIDLFYLLGGAKVRDILDWDVSKDSLDAARLASSENNDQRNRPFRLITRYSSLSPAADQYLVALAIVVVGLRHHSLLLLLLLMLF